MPLYEFNCMAHGRFERMQSMSAGIPKCPHGCSHKLVTKMVSAVSIVTNNKTKLIDKKTADLARQFGDTAMNDRYDSSRIDMTQTDDIMKKRLSDQTYSVPLDPKTGVAGYLGSTAAPEVSVSERARESANEGLRQTSVVHDDKGTTKLTEQP